MDEYKSNKPGQSQGGNQKLDQLIDQVNKNSFELKKTRKDIASLKEKIADLTSSVTPSHDNDSKDDIKPKYKKVLKVIDILALVIIIFVIIDGVFNGFAIMTAIANFFTALF